MALLIKFIVKLFSYINLLSLKICKSKLCYYMFIDSLYFYQFTGLKNLWGVQQKRLVFEKNPPNY